MPVCILSFLRGAAHSEVNFGASEGWGFCKFHKQTAKDGTIAGVMARLRLEAVEVAPVAQRMQTGYHALHSLLGWGSGGGGIAELVGDTYYCMQS